MRRLVLGWKMLGLERSLGSRIVTYADDLVILCQRGKGEAEADGQRREGTKLQGAREGEFNFLGYTFAQFCAATFLIRAWQRWVTGCPADRVAVATGPPQSADQTARPPA